MNATSDLQLVVETQLRKAEWHTLYGVTHAVDLDVHGRSFFIFTATMCQTGQAPFDAWIIAYPRDKQFTCEDVCTTFCNRELCETAEQAVAYAIGTMVVDGNLLLK